MEVSPSERIQSLRQFERTKRSRQLMDAKAITFGKEPVLIEEARYLPYDHYLCHSSTLCYHCDAANHSQHFCPLKQCATCFQFGHSFRACHKNRNYYAAAPKSKFFRSFLKSRERSGGRR
jgi:hypothetical protein